MEEGQFSNNSSTAHATSYDLQGIRGCTRHVRLGVRAADPPSGSECSAGSQVSHPACHQLPPDASTCHRHRKGLASFAPFAAGFVRSALDALKMLGSVVQIRPCPPDLTLSDRHTWRTCLGRQRSTRVLPNPVTTVFPMEDCISCLPAQCTGPATFLCLRIPSPGVSRVEGCGR